MIIENETIRQAEKIISMMSTERVCAIAQWQGIGDITSKQDLIDYLHEDYMYVIPLMIRLGILKILVFGYCENCDDEFEMSSAPPDWVFVCPKCKKEVLDVQGTVKC